MYPAKKSKTATRTVVRKNGSENPVIQIINSGLDKVPNGLFEELGRHIDLTRETLSNIYTGQRKMPIKNLQMLFNFLGCYDGNVIIEYYLRQPSPARKGKEEPK